MVRNAVPAASDLVEGKGKGKGKAKAATQESPDNHPEAGTKASACRMPLGPIPKHLLQTRWAPVGPCGPRALRALPLPVGFRFCNSEEFVGYLKSRSEKNGYGFIVCSEIQD